MRLFIFCNTYGMVGNKKTQKRLLDIFINLSVVVLNESMMFFNKNNEFFAKSSRKE